MIRYWAVLTVLWACQVVAGEVAPDLASSPGAVPDAPSAAAIKSEQPQPPVATPAAGGAESAAPASEAAPQTLTLTTGGELHAHNFSFFGKTKRRLAYPDAPELEKIANDQLAADGYDSTAAQPLWSVVTVAKGDPASYAPPPDGNEQQKAVVEAVTKGFIAVAVGILTRGNQNAMNSVTNTPSANNPNLKYLTRELLSGVPPGARKLIVTRIALPSARSQQEAITLAYSDVSDDELRRINFDAILTMIGLKKGSQ